MRQITLDTETTGLDPKKGGRIIEIGCVEIINRKITERHRQVLEKIEFESGKCVWKPLWAEEREPLPLTD